MAMSDGTGRGGGRGGRVRTEGVWRGLCWAVERWEGGDVRVGVARINEPPQQV